MTRLHSSTNADGRFVAFEGFDVSAANATAGLSSVFCEDDCVSVVAEGRITWLVQPCGAMKPLIIEPLAWIASAAPTLEAWRTNSPRPAIREDALLADLVTLESGRGMQKSHVTVTGGARCSLNAARRAGRLMWRSLDGIGV